MRYDLRYQRKSQRNQHKTGFQLDAFLDFYTKGPVHILEINHNGYDLAKAYARILLTKILTPYGTGFVDLQSHAGEGISVLVYNYDGDVYATDRTRIEAPCYDRRQLPPPWAPLLSIPSKSLFHSLQFSEGAIKVFLRFLRSYPIH
jgi:hypothetical protein